MNISNKIKSWLESWANSESENKAKVWIENWVKEKAQDITE